MKKMFVITLFLSLTVFAGLNLLEADPSSQFELCKETSCKMDGFCQVGRPESGWACTPQGSGPQDCSSYYNC